MSRRKRYTRNFGRTLKQPLPVRTTVEWVRFEHEHEPYGVFSYCSDARAALPKEALPELNELLRWFRIHLGAPADADHERFWFRAEASAFVETGRRLAELMRGAGI